MEFFSFCGASSVMEGNHTGSAARHFTTLD
jgi:hypothetical protein